MEKGFFQLHGTRQNEQFVISQIFFASSQAEQNHGQSAKIELFPTYLSYLSYFQIIFPKTAVLFVNTTRTPGGQP